MNGRKARARRRERTLLPPDLKREMKEKIAVVAAKRADTVGKASREREDAVRASQAKAAKSIDDAWLAYEADRAKIVAEYAARAAKLPERVAA